MGRPWQRMVGCTAAVVLALLVSGCEVRGTVDVKSGTEAVADLVFTESEADCLGLTKFAGLIIKGVPESGGDQTCRAQGTIDLEALKDLGIRLTHTGEYLIVDLALPQRVGYMPIEIDISFPGVVVEDAGMPVTGNSVRLGNATGISDFSPARVVALSHPGPQWWVFALAGGLVSGVALTLVGLLLVRRQQRLRAEMLADACAHLGRPQAMVRQVAAISVGIVDGQAVLDLDYPEDVGAGTDMNVVATGEGELIEVQGTAEGAPFARAELDALLDLALGGIRTLTSLQAQALAEPLRRAAADPLKM